MKPKIKQTIEEFKSLKQPNTQRCYDAAIRDLSEFLGKRPLEKCRPEDALRFVAYLKSRVLPDGTKLADNTIRNRFNCLTSLYNFLADIQAVAHNPFRAVKRAISWRQQIQKRPTRIIPFPAVQGLITAPDERTRDGVRDAAMLAVWFGCGLRRSELRHLTVGDVIVGIYFSKDGEEIYVLRLAKTKAGKRQEQPLPRWAWPFVSKLVSQRKSEQAQNQSPLFVFYYRDGSTKDAPLAESTVYRIYKRYTKAAPHSARATFATKLATQGKTLSEIAGALRHSGPTQAEVYIKIAKTVADNKGQEVMYFPVTGEEKYTEV